MTFFYDLNKKLDEIRATPSTTHGQLNERDMGKHNNATTGFKALAKKAGGGEKGEKIAGAQFQKMKKAGQLEEEGMSRAAKGYEKYGKQGMQALAKAGREGKALDPVRNKYDKYDNEVDEGLGDVVKKVGSMAKKAGGAVLNKVGHGDDVDMIRDLQRKMDMPQTGMKPGDEPNPKQIKEIGDTPAGLEKVKAYRKTVGQQMHKTGEYDTRNPEKKSNPFDARTDGHNPHKQAMRMAGASRANKIEKARAQGMPAQFQTQYEGDDDGISMTPKQKSFAKLAEPKDKITFADKIAGAKKEVDEMLGDVAAEAMKSALSGGQKKLDKNDNGKLDANDFAMLRKGNKQKTDEEEDLNPFTNYKKPRADRPKVGSIEHGALHDIEHTSTGRKVTRRTDPNTGHSVGADDDTPGEKRGRGRPTGKGAGKSIGAKVNSGKSKLMTKEGGAESSELKAAMMLLKKAGYKVSKSVEEEKTTTRDSHAEKAGRKVTKDIEYDEKKKDGIHGKKRGAEDSKAERAGKKVAKDIEYDEKKDKPKKVKEQGGTDTPTASSGFSYGQGIYDSMSRELEDMIAESMNISMSMNTDANGGPSKSLTVTATDDDAMKLSQLLKSAGLGGNDQGYGGTPDCSCGDQQMDEVSMNEPDYPTNTETAQDSFEYSGGLNGPKSTGQSTLTGGGIPNLDADRQHSYAEAEEDSLHRMMEMAGMKQNEILDEGMMDKIKGMLVPKLMKLLGPDAEKIANAVKQATGGDFTPSKENAMKVVQALGLDKAADQGQSPQMAEDRTAAIGGNWQGKLYQALYTMGLLGSAGAATAMYGTVGGSWFATVGVLLLMFAGTFFGTAPGQVGAMGNFGNKGTSMQKGLDDHGMPIRNTNVDEDDLARLREMAGIKEGKKPDFPDGDKKETIEKALDDKKAAGNKKVAESLMAELQRYKKV